MRSALSPLQLGYRVSAWNRERKWRLFLESFSPTASTTVLDVGYQDEQFQAADNYLEEHFPWPAQITALGVEEPVRFGERYPEVRAVTYDGVGPWPFEDQSFDIVWSNAVLEHVGDRAAQIHFLSEIRRVARRAFVTTPNRGFPVEVHSRLPLVHWAPKPVLDAALRLIGKPQFTGEYMRLLSARELRALMREAGYGREHRIVRNRLAGLTLDFVIVS